MNIHSLLRKDSVAEVEEFADMEQVGFEQAGAAQLGRVSSFSSTLRMRTCYEPKAARMELMLGCGSAIWNAVAKHVTGFR